MLSQLNIRPAIFEDTPEIFNLIKALAEYEQLSDRVTGNVKDLEQHLFGDRPYAEAIEQQIVNFLLNFSMRFR